MLFFLPFSLFCRPRKSSDQTTRLMENEKSQSRAHVSRRFSCVLRSCISTAASMTPFRAVSRAPLVRTVNRSICKAHVLFERASLARSCSRPRSPVFQIARPDPAGMRGHRWLLRVRLIAPSERGVRYWWPTSTVYYPLQSEAAISSFSRSRPNDVSTGCAPGRVHLTRRVRVACMCEREVKCFAGRWNDRAP